MKKILCLLSVMCVSLLSACSLTYPAGSGAEETADNGSLLHDGYTLEQVVVLSRHNIRSPLSGGDSLLGQITPHEWFEWTSAPSELSVRGGVLEANMGQYFRKWLEEEGLFPENYQPTDEEVRIYANSKQRTIATAKYFSAGLLPTDDNGVEYHMEFDEMDPVFTPQLTFTSDEYSEAAEAQVMELYSDDIESLSDNYDLLSDVI
ncbi:MAG: histidine-type phosphatase, partial [Lachnospiraceae bacterium]|nr:histidine-type phosphatase [Lachnospiraceae bacterium]